ncbi:MAG: hypothetical protein ACK56I_20320 [bacterium]
MSSSCYSDIACLARSKRHLTSSEQLLKKWKFSFGAEEAARREEGLRNVLAAYRHVLECELESQKRRQAEVGMA